MGAINILAYIVVLTLAAMTPASVLGNPVHSTTSRTIDNPCQRHSTETVYASLQEEMQATVAQLNALERACNDGINKMTTDVLLTEEEIQMLDHSYVTLPGLPTLPAEGRTISPANVTDVLKADYTPISIYTVFVRFLYEDDQVNDKILENELREMKFNLFSVLCRIDTILRSKHVEITSYVTDCVIPSEVRDVSNVKERYARAYIVMKNTRSHTRMLKQDYSTFLESYFTA